MFDRRGLQCLIGNIEDTPRTAVFFLGLNNFKEYYISVAVADMASQVVLVVKNPPASGGELREVGSIPRLGR